MKSEADWCVTEQLKFKMKYEFKHFCFSQTQILSPFALFYHIYFETCYN